MKINHIIKEFVTPQDTAQDPGLEREKDVDVIFYGQMPQDFTADTVAEALEEVLPREYPPGSSNTTNSNVYRVVTEIAKHQGAVVTTKPLSIAQKLVKTFQTYGIKCRIDTPGLEEGFVDTVKDKYAQVKDYFDDSPEAVERKLARLRATNAEAQPGANAAAAAAVTAQSAEDPYMILGVEHGADSNAIKLAYRRLAKKHHPDAGGSAAEFQKIKDAFNQLLSSGAVVREGTAGLPDPNNFDSDNDYYDARDAYAKPQDNDSDYENWAVDDANESKEKIGNMDADAFDAALARMKKLAGAGPLRTVYDPARRVYKNVPHAVQPAQQPKKAR